MENKNKSIEDLFKDEEPEIEDEKPLNEDGETSNEDASYKNELVEKSLDDNGLEYSNESEPENFIAEDESRENDDFIRNPFEDRSEDEKTEESDKNEPTENISEEANFDEERFAPEPAFDNVFSAFAPEPTSATYVEKQPIKDFLALLLIIPVLPLYIIYLIIKGKNKRFITYFFAGLILVSAVIFLSAKQYQLIKSREKKVIRNIDEYLGEPEINQKEFEKEYKNQVSTLASSIDASKIPAQLQPVLFIKQDMPTINYYAYLISAGYMGPNAEGAIYILQTALYSKNPELSEAAFKSLELIGNPQSKNIIELYKKANPKNAANDKKPAPMQQNDLGDKLKTEYDKFKYNLQNTRQ